MSANGNTATDYLAIQAFLDDAQMSKAFHCTQSGGIVTCAVSRSFYFKWVLFGLALGVIPTFTLLLRPWGIGPISNVPMVPRIFIILIVLLGWHLLLRGLLSRRTILFDFGTGHITLSKSYPTYSVRALDLLDVQELKIGDEAGFGRSMSQRPPPIGKVISLVMQNQETVKILKTLDAHSADQIMKMLAAASNGKLNLSASPA